MSKILTTYQQKTAASAQAHAIDLKYMPGGNSRQAGYWTPHPLTLAKGQGAYVYDVDGNRYFDLTNNYTSLVHGHDYPPVVAAAAKQLKAGLAWSANNLAQTQLARLLVERVPSIDHIRFANSGSEAANLALHIARTITGKRKVLMSRYGYHGSLEVFQVGAFDLEGPETLTGQYNDAESFETILEQSGDEIAAVFLEPVQGAGGIVPAQPEFLKRVQKAAQRANVLLVFDEVISVRLATGGAQSLLGITPDLTMLGKLIGGGFPVGAVGGRRELFTIFDPKNLKAWHSGTFNGNPMTMAAGAAAVRELTREKIEAMSELAVQLQEGLLASGKKLGLPITVSRQGSLLNVFFLDQQPKAVLVREDQRAIEAFHIAAMNHGLMIASRGMIALSTIMTAEDIKEIIERAALAMEDVTMELAGG